MRKILLFSLTIAAWTASAFLPPVSERDGLSVRIEGFDEKNDGPQLQVVTRATKQPFEFEVRLSNKTAKSVTGVLSVWLNDDWVVHGPKAETLTLAPGQTRSVKRTAAATARVLPALYPVHAAFTPAGGEVLHPIAVFRADGPKPSSAVQSAKLPTLSAGLVRLDGAYPKTVTVSVKGKVKPLIGGNSPETGAMFHPGSVTAGGVSRGGFHCHPPYRGGAGVIQTDFVLKLPEIKPCRFTFATALGTHSPSEPPSDGTEHKVIVIDAKGVQKELFTRFDTNEAWKEAAVDLSSYVGQTVTLRLVTGPGPKMNTCCDRCMWGDPIVRIGPIPAASTEAEWLAREKSAVSAAEEARVHGTKASAGRFRLVGSDGAYGAAWVLGPQGVIDGVLAVTDGQRTLSWRGFVCEVDNARVGAGPDAMACTDMRTSCTGDVLTIEQNLTAGAYGTAARLRTRIREEKGCLRISWDMPGVVRDGRGSPRYTTLSLGNGSLPARRAYAGFGNVIEEPRNFSLSAGGFSLSTRHVGADYTNGLSLVQAVDIFPDRLVCSRDRKTFALVTHHDATFTFIPSARGAFAAARRFRKVSGYVKSPGYDSLLGRMCLDQWGGDYARAAEGLTRAAKYGLNDSVFVKHVWQRWGYDYRLPEIWPPQGSVPDFLKMGHAARAAGILFCPHDNYIDFYPDAEDYSYDQMIFNADGTPQLAWYNRGRRARSYRWAPHAFLPWLERNADRLKAGCSPDAIFIDVFTAIAPMDYYDRAGTFYPKMRTQAEWGRAFDTYRVKLGRPEGVMISEAGTDALVGHLDAGQSDHFPARRWMNASEFADSERTPWHDMVTHGSFILLAGGLGHRYADLDWEKSGDTILHGYGSDDYLCNTVIGGRAPMCDGPFSRRAVATYWLLHDICDALARAEFESLEYIGSIHRQYAAFSDGGHVWINRTTNAAWTVNGHVLPSYGFHAFAPGLEAGIVEKKGQRCAFARAKDVLFVDARPDYDVGARLLAVSAATAFKADSPSAGRLTTRWELKSAFPDYRPFLHVVPENGGSEPILFQGSFLAPQKHFNAAGSFTADFAFTLPKDLKAGRYDIRYGAFRSHVGTRIAFRGQTDGSQRIRGGTLIVEKSGERFTRLSWEPAKAVFDGREMNLDRTMLSFDGVQTDGAFRLNHPSVGLFDRLTGRRADWTVTPLPGSRAFKAIFDLSALGASGAKVASVEALEPETDAAALTWKQNGDTLELSADARAFAYRLIFK